MKCLLAEITKTGVALFSVAFLFTFLLLVAAFFFTAWKRRHAVSLSPYSGLPLRRAADLPYESKKRILQFLYDKHEYDNRIFEFKRASVCRETGRIFTNSVTWLDTIDVDWSFLQKRYPGNYVSWGSLNDTQQTIIREAHTSLNGFQTDFSSPHPAPRAIEVEYAFSKPGPLYVDLVTKVLLGWQCVPGTTFEVLIVKKPKLRGF